MVGAFAERPLARCQSSGAFPSVYPHGLTQTFSRNLSRELAGKVPENVGSKFCVLKYRILTKRGKGVATTNQQKLQTLTDILWIFCAKSK